MLNHSCFHVTSLSHDILILKYAIVIYFPVFHLRYFCPGTSLVVQWLRLSALTAGVLGLIPGQGTKILHAVCGQKTKTTTTKGLCFVPVFQSETGLCFSLLCYFIKLMYLSYISFAVKFLKMSVLGKIKVALDHLVFEGLAEFLVKPSAHANF